MPRLGSTNRCPRCWIRPDLCFCAEIPELKPETRVLIYMHYRELKLPSNTARLTQLCLPQTEIRVRGLPNQPVSSEGLHVKGRRPVFLYPSEEARELNADFKREFPGPYTLIVPDGSWRQASKVYKREAIFKGIQTVKLPPGPESEYQLRRETDSRHVCTIEAIARSLGILEGMELQHSIEKLFRVMVQRSLIARGKLPDPRYARRPI